MWIVLLLLLTASSIIIAATHRDSGDSSPGAHQSTQSAQRTATISVSSTPLPTAINTPVIDQTPTPLFYENFGDNSKGWAITDTPDFTRMLEGKELTLSVTNHNILTETIPSTTPFGDCTINIEFALRKADANDSMGLYVRGDGLLFHDYRIDVFGNNTVALSKEYLDANKKPQTLEFEKTAHLSALAAIGKPNILTVIMKGPYVMLRINNTTIKTLVDSDYARGQIALFASNGPTSDGVVAVFSSVKITQVPDRLPGLPMSTATATGTAQATQ
ncbi:MAG: hypothetical protein NVS2B12_25990 [Ktedonobacteraceae bacterium]